MLRGWTGGRRSPSRFPATPAFLRLARLTSADAGSRAGFDYEDIDDLRIAVSELCSLISGAPSGDITLRFQIDEGVVEVEGHASQGTLVENEFSRMIVDAVVGGSRVAVGRRGHHVPVHETLEHAGLKFARP